MITEERTLSITLNGITYNAQEIKELNQSVTDEPPVILRDLFAFLDDWYSPSPTLVVHTSGSTGTPKPITVLKEQMIKSAQLTCDYLQLRRGDTALLCMPLQYIAGKMMVVRALVAGLNLLVREPSGHPLAHLHSPLRFAAMIPLQVYNSLQNPAERQALCGIEQLIIGGGAINSALEEEIKTLPGAVYSTYGMTETLSHIALRRLNGPNASSHYQPFEQVKLSLSDQGTLVIDAPSVCAEQLVTNDVARIFDDGSFTILGRKDNIINTGGIKVQTEWVEEQLRPLIGTDFAITSVPHSQLGEAVVLLLKHAENINTDTLRTQMDEFLPKYHSPKYILITHSIPQTGSGKIDRAGCKELAQRLMEQH